MAGNTIPKKPQYYNRGDSFDYDGKTWVVSDYSLASREGYKERQWTVHAKFGGVAYLLLCIEEVQGSTEEKWIFSRPIALSHVSFPSHLYTPSPERVPAESAPEVTYNGEKYYFKESYEIKAKDDEGNFVPELTWDYYDHTGKINLAIEIWEEADRNYPEAYLGVLIDPGILVYRGRSHTAAIYHISSNLLWIAFCIVFCLLGNGVPGDWILAGVMAVLGPIAAVIMFSGSAGLAVFAGAAAIAIVLSAALASLPGLFAALIIAAASTVAAILFSSGSAGSSLGISGDDLPAAAGLTAFTAAAIYGFVVYFRFAPGPHNGGQILAVLLLPVIIGGITMFIGWGWKRRG